MPFKEGNQDWKKHQRPWKAAIERALNRAANGQVDYFALDQVADALIRKAKSGDINAIKEIGDRVDGRVLNGDEVQAANPFMVMNAQDVINLIASIGRARNIALPSAIARAATPEAGDLQTIQETD